VRLVERTHPASRLAVDGPNEATVAFFAESGCRRYAEIGVYEGHTAERIAAQLAGDGEIHLFDYEDKLAPVLSRLRSAGYENVVGHPNTRALMDSYNWSLMQMVEAHDAPVLDYVFLDGAHTWVHDALAFLLADRLLTPGGYVDFDDYTWRLETSLSMRPEVFPDVRRLYSEEQIGAAQVALVVELLVRRDGRYEEVVRDKIFRKREIAAP
jgi:predicted O-methyltransferase YrrM